MNLYNVLATISKITGDATSKAYSTIATGVRVLITPATMETLAVYPDIPVGQSYNFTIFTNDIATIPPESTITVTTSNTGEITVSDQFVTRGNIKKQKLLEQIVLSGVCVKQ